jgi:hypothetical protein
MSRRIRALRTLVWGLTVALAAVPSLAQAQQRIDEEYTKLIKEHLQDARITTELVDHLPASETVPTPLDFHGRIVGTPGELTYAADIHRYLRAIADASPRATVWSIGQSEEGREMILMAIADEETIANLERYKGYMKELTDPRVTSEARAQELINGMAKPIYWYTSGMHSPETGGPEMLQEMAYRLVVEETPFIQGIRNNIITFITPVIEVDGREKQVDTYYFNKERPDGEGRLPLMYWGKYVAHDNNRDGMGQFLALTRNVEKVQLEWAPTVMHDLHEAQTYLYSSTGTGPYNESFDAITIGEWWTLAQNDVTEMTKRGVPGVFTYGFYDGWTPNYMFTIAHAHNAIGRFYEVASYGPDNRTLRAGATTTSREWYRPNPPFPSIEWGPRNNTNIQQSAALLSLKYVADRPEWFLDNYWLKNKRQVELGKTGDVNAWVIPAGQRRHADAVDAVNELLRQGLEIHQAEKDFTAGGMDVKKGDFIARADQPFRILADMYFGLQQFSLDNPRPYDDTGWTFQLMRNVEIDEIKDGSVFEQSMSRVAYPVKATGGVNGRGNVIVVDHTTDNNLMAFRFRHAGVRMLAAEKDFEMSGHEFRAGAFIIPDADRATIEASLTDLGLSAFAGSMPDVPTHELDVPRIGYVHSWQRTQDEGWVRAALDTYGVPYDYFADQTLKQGNLKAKYDVIIFPHVGGDAQSQVNGIALTGELPLPYKKTDKTPNLGALDESDDIRGGMGFDGLVELARFVRDGGTLITEGSTSTIFPSYGITQGVNVDDGEGLIAPGSVHRGMIADKLSPIAYGYDGDQLPVYYKGDVILSSGGQFGRLARAFGAGGGSSPWQNTTPMASRPRLSPYEAPAQGQGGREGQVDELAEFRAMARQFGMNVDDTGPRVIMKFPDRADRMLLSGALDGGEVLQGKAQVVDASVGDGHVVLFAIRPYWRWQTQGTFFLGFNAILNWNDLDAGKPEPVATDAPAGGRGSR